MQSSFRSGARAAAFLVLAFAASLGTRAHAQTCSSPASPVKTSTVTTGQITVSGTQLLKDGKVWAPHGLNTIAFVTPFDAETGVYATAHTNFSNSTLDAMKTWGVDTVRFQVSELGLDPCSTSPAYQQNFVDSFAAAVNYARSIGLNAIVSIQDEQQATAQTNEPDVTTQRVWQVLAPLFNSDKGILYELFNEPADSNTAANWQTWQTAHNTLIGVIRATAGPGGTLSHNVVIADGLNKALDLDGALALTDKVNETAYAIHPYFHGGMAESSSHWNTTFGTWAASYPVVVTEWTTIYQPPSAGGTYYCMAATGSYPSTTAAGLSLMQYLANKGIGITAYAYDFSGPTFGSAVYGFSPPTTTTTVNKQCGDTGYGPGLTLQKWFTSGTVPANPL